MGQMGQRIKKGDCVKLRHDKDETVGAVVRSRGRFADIQWPERNRVMMHRKDFLTKISKREVNGQE